MAQPGFSMLLVGMDSELEGRLLSCVRGVSVMRAPLDAQAVSDAVIQARPAAAIVPVRDLADGDLPFQVVSGLTQGGTRVIVYGPHRDAELILRAMRAGAQEFVIPGEEKLLGQTLRMRAEPDSASIITLFPVKGGLGSTSVAAHLAAAMSEAGKRVCLLDLDLQFGGALSLLDMKGTYAVSDVIANMHRLDRELLDSSIERHDSGLFVLGQGEKIEEADSVQPKDLGALLTFLRPHYDYLIIDGIRGFTELSLAVLDATDQILMLATQEVTAVRNAQRAAELLRRLGYDDVKLRLVINRYEAQGRLDAALLTEATGLEPAGTLRNDFPSLSEAANKGVLVSQSAPRSPLSHDIDQLATLLGGGSARPAPRSFFSRLFSRG